MVTLRSTLETFSFRKFSLEGKVSQLRLQQNWANASSRLLASSRITLSLPKEGLKELGNARKLELHIGCIRLHATGNLAKRSMLARWLPVAIQDMVAIAPTSDELQQIHQLQQLRMPMALVVRQQLRTSSVTSRLWTVSPTPRTTPTPVGPNQQRVWLSGDCSFSLLSRSLISLED